MNSLLKVLISGVLLIGAGAFALNKYNDNQEQYEYRLAKERLRAEYLERAPSVWGIQDPDRYREEVRGLFKWYYGALTNLYNRFPEHRDGPTYLDELEARRAKGRISESELAEHKAVYDQVQAVWEQIRNGAYAPAMTATDAGLRIDFLEFEQGTVQGQRAIQGRFILWGAQRKRVEEKLAKGATLSRVDVQATFPDIMLSMVGKNGKPVAEASFSIPNGPYVPYPESRLEDFPPMAYIGSFAFPLLPAEAETMEMQAGAVSRSITGAEIRASYEWKQAVPAQWKLRDGETWEGAETEIREELR